VPFVGVYSTDAHRFCLIYEYMDGLDLRQYLRSEPNVPGRLKLVLIYSYLFATHKPSYRSCQQLLGIARGLSRMHDLGIIHGNLQTVGPPLFAHPHHTIDARLIP